MRDTTIKKVDSDIAQGETGQRYLVSGKSISMRLRVDEPARHQKKPSTRDYETVGFVMSGKAALEIEGQTINLAPGDSWLVSEGALHRYKILEPFTAVEATSPPAEVHGRDEPN